MSYIQYGLPPERRLSAETRQAVAQLLQKDIEALGPMFTGLETILTAHSPDAQPLTTAKGLSSVRRDLDRLQKAADALEEAWQLCGQQTSLRLSVGCMFAQKGTAPIGDFRAKLTQFRQLVGKIDSAVAPLPGGRARADHLRIVTQLCAEQYYATLGKWPARRQGGIFDRLMRLVLPEIGLQLPRDPYNILKPAIDAAEARTSPPP